MDSISHRRRGITGLGAGALLVLALIAARAEAQPPPPPAPTPAPAVIHVRRNVATLTSAQVAALRKGVQVMKSRPSTDPTSWLYQANMHGVSPVPSPLPAAWNSCQHGSFFFLSWHRMYLYYFERILRKASGDPNLALPYWNYTDPTQRRLPLPYRSPVGSSNSLYVSARAPGMNSGTASLPASSTSFSTAFSFLNFFSSPGSGASFGGQRLTSPSHGTGPHGAIESQPHDVIHGLVGGQTGLMSYVSLAARDPIFWAHHANIDRLWKRWLAQGGGRNNPTADSVWMNTNFTFFDENGQQVQMSGKQILNTVTQLNYRYDDDPPPVTPLPVAPSGRTLGPGETPPPPEVVAAAPTPQLQLAGKKTSVAVPVQAEAQPKLRGAFAAIPDTHVILNVEGITLDTQPGLYYEVYVNLPEGQQPDYQSIYYVGNLPFFGFEAKEGHAGAEGGKHSFDITALARELKAQNLWKEGNVSVTFVPRGLEGQPAKPTGPTVGAEPTPTVKIGRVTLMTVSD